jgi:hypothetical protein
MCEIVFSDEFETLKHLRLSYVQGNHVHRILRGSTSLTNLAIECFYVELGTPDVRSMVKQHINLKQIIIEAYDRKETGNAAYMNMNELIKLSRYLPNIEHVFHPGRICNVSIVSLNLLIIISIQIFLMNVWRIRKN